MTVICFVRFYLDLRSHEEWLHKLKIHFYGSYVSFWLVIYVEYGLANNKNPNKKKKKVKSHSHTHTHGKTQTRVKQVKQLFSSLWPIFGLPSFFLLLFVSLVISSIYLGMHQSENVSEKNVQKPQVHN